jgi:hypothetical protein
MDKQNGNVPSIERAPEYARLVSKKSIDTPQKSVVDTLSCLSIWYCRYMSDVASQDEASSNFESMVREALSDEELDQLYRSEEPERIQNIMAKELGSDTNPQEAYFSFSVVYAVCAIWASLDDKENLSWVYAANASTYCTFILLLDFNKGGVTENARKAANFRHESTRKLAAEIRKWYLDNKESFRSKHKAAEEAETLYPRSYETIRKYLRGL